MVAGRSPAVSRPKPGWIVARLAPRGKRPAGVRGPGDGCRAHDPGAPSAVAPDASSTPPRSLRDSAPRHRSSEDHSGGLCTAPAGRRTLPGDRGVPERSRPRTGARLCLARCGIAHRDIAVLRRIAQGYARRPQWVAATRASASSRSRRRLRGGRPGSPPCPGCGALRRSRSHRRGSAPPRQPPPPANPPG